MTSTKLVKSEIKRFLASKDPEVLCITGAWGVGKTYTWKTLLEDAAEGGSLGLTSYSYASLFGLSSLAELKLTIAENLQVLRTDDLVIDQGKTKAKNFLLGSVKHLKGFTSAIPFVGKAISESGDLYFSLVANGQLVCIDDLDRRGEKLRVEDVLGLVSFLKEEKKCKVVLLLNEEQLQGKDKDAFDRLFEKVIDARLVFVPTAAEAVAIAITGTDEISRRIAQNCERLGISNIRVIKKIERLVREIDSIVSDRSEAVRVQTAHTLTLLGWTKFQPDLAPPFEFYATDSFSRYVDDKELSEEEVTWTSITERYGFADMDGYDAVLMDCIKTGIADVDAIKAKAREQDEAQGDRFALAAIGDGFRLLHDSFDDNLDEVVMSISDTLAQNYRFVSLNTLNDTISMLKNLDRPDDARRLLEFFEKNQKDDPDFWNPDNDPLRRPISDPDLKKVSDRVRASNIPVFEPVREMLNAAASMNSATVKEVADRVTADDIYSFIKERRGDDMRAVIGAGLGYKRISNASPDMQTIVRATIKALKRIGTESKLNEIRIKKHGVSLDSSGASPTGGIQTEHDG
jgi:hypothetical protein